jgi:hypothetical protein
LTNYPGYLMNFDDRIGCVTVAKLMYLCYVIYRYL